MAKALTKYAKDNPEFTFKAGVVEGRVITIKEIEALATHAVEGRALFEAAVPDQCSGAASGDGDERGGPRTWRWWSTRA